MAYSPQLAQPASFIEPRAVGGKVLPLSELGPRIAEHSLVDVWATDLSKLGT